MAGAPEPIRVLVADAHELARRGLESVLQAEPGIAVVGELADGAHAARRVRDLRPDVVLMAVRMPGAGGIDALRSLREVDSEVRVVMLADSDDADDLVAAVRAGADGYLLKDEAAVGIAEAVRTVYRGGAVLAPALTRALFDACRRVASGDEGTADGRRRLSPRELEVLRLVARGRSNREIAAELVIAQDTVKNHVRNILGKLKLKSRTEAATYAVRERLFDAP
ncbi:MAG: DNA-binding response regulator [Acidimicrobiia bacterium]|nr:MAG: DNA-binding response regulator [Acidimicrobiia bacterium]